MQGYGSTHTHTHTHVYIRDTTQTARPQPLVYLKMWGQMFSLRVQVQQMYRHKHNHFTFIQNYKYKKQYNCHYIVNALKSGHLGLAVSEEWYHDSIQPNSYTVLVVNKLAGWSCTPVQWLQYFFASVSLSWELLITIEWSQPPFGEHNIMKTKSVQVCHCSW